MPATTTARPCPWNRLSSDALWTVADLLAPPPLGWARLAAVSRRVRSALRPRGRSCGLSAADAGREADDVDELRDLVVVVTQDGTSREGDRATDTWLDAATRLRHLVVVVVAPSPRAAAASPDPSWPGAVAGCIAAAGPHITHLRLCCRGVSVPLGAWEALAPAVLACQRLVDLDLDAACAGLTDDTVGRALAPFWRQPPPPLRRLRLGLAHNRLDGDALYLAAHGGIFQRTGGGGGVLPLEELEVDVSGAPAAVLEPLPALLGRRVPRPLRRLRLGLAGVRGAEVTERVDAVLRSVVGRSSPVATERLHLDLGGLPDEALHAALDQMVRAATPWWPHELCLDVGRAPGPPAPGTSPPPPPPGQGVCGLLLQIVIRRLAPHPPRVLDLRWAHWGGWDPTPALNALLLEGPPPPTLALTLGPTAFGDRCCASLRQALETAPPRRRLVSLSVDLTGSQLAGRRVAADLGAACAGPGAPSRALTLRLDDNPGMLLPCCLEAMVSPLRRCQEGAPPAHLPRRRVLVVARAARLPPRTVAWLESLGRQAWPPGAPALCLDLRGTSPPAAATPRHHHQGGLDVWFDDDATAAKRGREDDRAATTGTLR